VNLTEPTEPTVTGTAGSRADRFVRELAELKIPDPAAGRAALWLRTGATLMVLGLIAGGAAYLMSHGTRDPLVQRDALTLGLLGVGGAVVGSALFLRYSLTGFLRFWMARQSYDLTVLADRVLAERAGRGAQAEQAGPTPGKDDAHEPTAAR
jgi:energy-converting hydrogenase Eha subunit E